jgi:hypothetical protein
MAMSELTKHARLKAAEVAAEAARLKKQEEGEGSGPPA